MPVYFVTLFLLLCLGLASPLQAKTNELKELPSLLQDELSGFLLSKGKNSAKVQLRGIELFSLTDNQKEENKDASERAENANVELMTLAHNIETSRRLPKLRVQPRGEEFLIKAGKRTIIVLKESDLTGLVGEEESVAFFKRRLERAFSQILAEADQKFPLSAYWQIGLLFAGFLLASFLFLWFLKLSFPSQNALLVLALLWAYFLNYLFGLFPHTRSFQQPLSGYFLNPLFNLAVALLAFFLTKRLSVIVTEWWFRRHLTLDWSPNNRRHNARFTIKKVFDWTGNWLAGFVALLVCLAAFGLDFHTIAASAGVIGLGFGFIGQDFIKGFLSALSVIFEDKFSVGDVVRLGGHQGQVEDFNLQYTKLRNMEGALITVPNKDISAVENLTSCFAQVDLMITVAQDSDLGLALALLDEESEALAQAMPEQLLGKPDLLGVDQVGDLGITLRLTLKTIPMQQWSVRRKLLLRVLERFAKEGIRLPSLDIGHKKPPS